jgi:hypothetical protein
MPLPPLRPGASMASGPFLPTLRLLARLFGLLTGTSIINGDFMFLGGASTTIGTGLSGALMLGARLLLLALDGATDILLVLLLLFLDVNDDALDRGEVVRMDSVSLLEARSVWSSHPWTWPNLSSDSVTLVATWAWSLD